MDDRAALERTLNRARRALQILEEQKAGYGLRVPVDLVMELEDKQREVAALEARRHPLLASSPVLSASQPAHTPCSPTVPGPPLYFDVFLCHNSADKPVVIQIGTQLQQRGLQPWLDVWELRPGMAWQPLLEQQIEHIGAAAVFVGQAGLGPWQEQEMYAFLRAFVQRQCPVMPVLLPNAPARPQLPISLQGMTWVDFRVQNPDPLERLIWGITGRKPGVP